MTEEEKQKRIRNNIEAAKKARAKKAHEEDSFQVTLQELAKAYDAMIEEQNKNPNPVYFEFAKEIREALQAQDIEELFNLEYQAVCYDIELAIAIHGQDIDKKFYFEVNKIRRQLYNRWSHCQQEDMLKEEWDEIFPVEVCTVKDLPKGRVDDLFALLYNMYRDKMIEYCGLARRPDDHTAYFSARKDAFKFISKQHHRYFNQCYQRYKATR